jgi:hypothetical protein
MCDPDLVCLSGFCVDPGPQCPAGTETCPCTQGGGCDPGLACLSNTCVDPSDLTTGDPSTTAPSETGSETTEPGTDTSAAADSSSSSTGTPDPDSTG